MTTMLALMSCQVLRGSVKNATNTNATNTNPTNTNATNPTNTNATNTTDTNATNPKYANLIYANLTYANLTYANLTYANLTYANLTYANLTYANLTYADYEEEEGLANSGNATEEAQNFTTPEPIITGNFNCSDDWERARCYMGNGYCDGDTCKCHGDSVLTLIQRSNYSYPYCTRMKHILESFHVWFC
ncbi:hypothetical protein HELRODRAFT_176270 [Helobdella robusta]|uniref:Uncharacterized protein n=1 Tax=Helobdella robusta TaxID=6412 RepID=T1FAC7_HELRO|nr:hypothetical protein HELRODRAFT_176270 [Helobdella robusta]ESN99969.1 hypothetical protein HELRODRAFT_176270 [Helobdella robusta]